MLLKGMILCMFEDGMSVCMFLNGMSVRMFLDDMCMGTSLGIITLTCNRLL